MYDTNTITPEMMQAILQLNQQKSEQARINRQMQMANLMRQQGQAGTQATSPGGGRAGAPNIFGNLANVYGAYKARGIDQQAALDQAALAEQEQKASQRILDAVTASMRNAQNRRNAGNTPPPEQDSGEFL